MWLYEGLPFESEIKGYEGFVYLIENLTNGRKYIGKKSFWSRQKDRRKGYRVTKESDWRSYTGSSDDLNKDIELLGLDQFKRTIIHICVYKKQMSFLEQKEQWDCNVLLTDEYYNTNIGGKFFVRERKIYECVRKEVTDKNDNWRKIKSERMKGDNNTAKRPDVRAKISAKKQGRNNPRYGAIITEDHRNKLHQAKRQKIDDGDRVWNSKREYIDHLCQTKLITPNGARMLFKKLEADGTITVTGFKQTHSEETRLKMSRIRLEK